MLRPRFSFLNMLLLITIIGMAIILFAQYGELAKFRESSTRLANELGLLGDIDRQTIAMRRLAAKGELNTWRFRVSKPSPDYVFCYGIVDVNPLGNVLLPTEEQRYFRFVESESEGETEVVLHVWQQDSRWFLKFEEFESHPIKSTTYRADGFPDQAVADIVQLKTRPFKYQFVNQEHTDESAHSDVFRFDTDETVILFRSEKSAQPPESRRAFVLALRPRPKPAQNAE